MISFTNTTCLAFCSSHYDIYDYKKLHVTMPSFSQDKNDTPIAKTTRIGKVQDLTIGVLKPSLCIPSAKFKTKLSASQSLWQSKTIDKEKQYYKLRHQTRKVSDASSRVYLDAPFSVSDAKSRVWYKISANFLSGHLSRLLLIFLSTDATSRV